MGIFLNNLTPVNEVYFGKTPQILACEQQLDKFRNKYIGRYTFNMTVNADPDLLKFNRMMEDVFGFGTLSLNIINQPVVNAYTYPVSFRFDTFMNHANDCIVDKSGYRFKKEYDYAAMVYIYSGIIFNPNFTTAEVMAVILHEIGHNFQAEMSNTNAGLSDAFMFLRTFVFIFNGHLISMLLQTNTFYSWKENIKKNMRENGAMPLFLWIIDVYKAYVDICGSLSVHINDLAELLTLNLSTPLRAVYSACLTLLKKYGSLNPFSIILNILVGNMHYLNEKSSDNFATMYGYGQETISVQRKFRTKEGRDHRPIQNIKDSLPLIGTISNFNYNLALLVIQPFDEHPVGIVRAKDQLKLLNHELYNADLDPKMKKVIQADIKACEMELDKFYRVESSLDPDVGFVFFNRVRHALFDDRTIKDMFIDGDPNRRFDEYDASARKLKGYDKY